MSIKIDDFKSSISKHRGLAKANRFHVSFTGLSASEDIHFLAEAATLPGRSISTSEHAFHRETHKHPYSFIDEDVTISFLVTTDYYIRAFIEGWIQQVFDTENYTIGYKSDYAKTVKISSYDDNTLGFGVELINAWPVSVGQIEYSNSSENTIVTLPVTFAYDRYLPIDSTGGSIASYANIPSRIISGLENRATNAVARVQNRAMTTVNETINDALAPIDRFLS